MRIRLSVADYKTFIDKGELPKLLKELLKEVDPLTLSSTQFSGGGLDNNIVIWFGGKILLIDKGSGKVLIVDEERLRLPNSYHIEEYKLS